MKWIRICGHIDFVVRQPQKVVWPDFLGDKAILTNVIGSFISFSNAIYYHSFYFTTILLLWMQFLLFECKFYYKIEIFIVKL
jgi:hypothetical protein